MNELRDFERELRAALEDVERTADLPDALAEHLIANTPRRAAARSSAVRARLRRTRWLPPALAAAAVVTAVATAAVVTNVVASDDKTQPGTNVPSIKPTRTPSQTHSPSPTETTHSRTSSSAPSTTPPVVGGTAIDWDVDGDGRPDIARLVYLGGYEADNWKIVVRMTNHGKAVIRFSGDPAWPGATNAPTIAGSVDANRDGRAEIFVKTSSGASTQFWTIFELDSGHLVQVTSNDRPVRLAVGGTVTHQSGFRCHGTQLVTTGASIGYPDATRISYERDTFTWREGELVQASHQTGHTTGTGAPYGGVRCGDLPQYAPGYQG
jgi:hypothetical protein